MFCQCLCEVYTCCIDVSPTSPGQNFIIELSLSALKQDFCETVCASHKSGFLLHCMKGVKKLVQNNYKTPIGKYGLNVTVRLMSHFTRLWQYDLMVCCVIFKLFQIHDLHIKLINCIFRITNFLFPDT